MKALLRLLLVTVLAGCCTGCLFQEPVFTTGFQKIDPALGGVWAAEGKEVDPRNPELAVFAPLDEDRYLLHYASGTKDGMYFEGRLLKIGERRLLQLRMVAMLNSGVTSADAERFTVAWIEQKSANDPISVRVLSGEGVKEKGAAEVKRLLEAPSTDWETLFGETMNFRRLKDN